MTLRTLHKTSSHGYSLIELLIALVIGLMLTAGMISVFSGNKRSADLNTAIANLQESARFALDTMSEDIRMAGFQGCTPIGGGSVRIIANNAPITDHSEGLRSSAIWASVVESANSWEPMPPWGAGTNEFSVPTGITGVPGTHALAVQFGGPETYRLESAMASPNDPLVIEGTVDRDDIDVGKLAIISDCIDGDLFEVSSVATIGGNSNLGFAAGANSQGTLSNAYGKSEAQRRQTMIMGFNARVYFVGDSGEDDENGNPITALYQMTPPFDASNPPVEIVQGVEEFAVSFEVSDDIGTRRTVVPGDASFDPANITAVRIGVLLTSREAIAEQDDNTTYTLAGIDVPPASSGEVMAGEPSHAGDRRFRLAFNTTVKVRNFRHTGS